MSGGLGLQALLEGMGRRITGMVAIMVGIVPMMLGVIMGVGRDSLLIPAVWTGGICPVSWPVYGAGVFLSQRGLPPEAGAAVPDAFWFSQVAAILAVGWLLLKLRASRKRLSKASETT